MSSARAGSSPGWSRITPCRWWRWSYSFHGGAAQDPQGKAGAAALLAGMLDEGAGELDAEAFHRALDDHAIRLSFNAERDDFGGHLQTLSRHTGKAFELLALAVNAPRFDAAPLERVRGQINAMLKRESKEPDAMAAQAWRRAAWPGHPYSRSSRGELGEVDAVTREDLVALHKKLLARDTLEDRRGRGDRRRDSGGPSRRGFRRAAAKIGADAGSGDRGVGPRPAHRGRFRRAAGQYPLRPAGHRAARPGLHHRHGGQPHSRRRRPSPRGCSRKCAKSAA